MFVYVQFAYLEVVSGDLHRKTQQQNIFQFCYSYISPWMIHRDIVQGAITSLEVSF
jgi:hypothetical protein